MTLVVSVATSEFLVQVSDRRLTRPSGGLVGDDAIKAVAYCNFMAVSYTGLARISGERTDLWTANQLQQVRNPSPGHAAAKLREAAEAAFQDLPSLYPHAFVAIGWLSKEDGGDFHPFVATVSNFHDEDGVRLPEPRREFRARISYSTRKDLFALDVTGQSLSSRELSSLARTIRRGLARSAGQRAVMRLLAHQIRQVADRNTRVGKDLLATCYPVDAVAENALLPSYIIKGQPRETGASFHDLRHGDGGGCLYQPHIVGPGFKISDLRLEGPTSP